MKNVYFIGIGGIGMSAIARCYMQHGYCVAGFDRTSTAITQALQNEGAHIHYNDNPALIPQDFCNADTLVIYTPAVGSDNAELEFFRQNGNEIIKRSAALGKLSNGMKLLAVAGTHGKTTTSAMLAHILRHSSCGCTAFLGGIAKNYGTNFLLPHDNDKYNVMVAEADEYDRSFLQLFPYIAVITSMDADHLDIYGNHNMLQNAFFQFAQQVKQDGILICKDSIAQNFESLNRVGGFSYSCENESDFYAKNVRQNKSGHFNFDIVTPFGTIEDCMLGTIGYINIENAVAAVAAALSFRPALIRSVNADGMLVIKSALKSFSGVQRRLDVQINTNDIVYIDDYAHHPAELTAAIASVRKMFPNKKITGIFQPHLYSRTRDFAKEFGTALSNLDSLILLPIYPARELPIENVSEGMIFDNVRINEKKICSKEEALNYVKRNKIEVLLTLGAGDIDALVEPIRKLLTQ